MDYLTSTLFFSKEQQQESMNLPQACVGVASVEGHEAVSKIVLGNLLLRNSKHNYNVLSINMVWSKRVDQYSLFFAMLRL